MPFDSKDTIIKSGYTPLIQWNKQGVTSPIATKNNIELFNFENKNNNGLVIEHSHKKKSESTKQTKTNTLQERIVKIEKELKKAENSNGLVGKAWSWFKNKTDGFLPVDSSNKVRKQLEIEKQKIKDIQKPEVFKELTGIEYSDENYAKFEQGEIKLLSEQKLEGYKEGQDMVVDVVADVGAGIAAGVALAAAPVTGGASLLLAAGVGGVTKLGIKATSAGIRGKDYSGKDILKDLGTGAITGLLTPVTMEVGGAVGNVSARVGARVFGQSVAGKIATKTTTFVLREGSIGAVFGGGAEGLGEVGRQGYHAVADGEDFDLGRIYEKTKEGAIGGAVAGVFMNGGMKVVSKCKAYLNETNVHKIVITKDKKVSSFYKLLKSKDILSLKLGKLINIGGSANVYELKGFEELYIVRLEKKSSFDIKKLKLVKNSSKYNPIVAQSKDGKISIQKKICGEPLYDKSWQKNLIEEIEPNLELFYGTLNKINDLPDKTFIEYINNIIDIRNNHYNIDAINPNNFLLDLKNQKINFVDLEYSYINNDLIKIEDFFPLLNHFNLIRILSKLSPSEREQLQLFVRNFLDRMIKIAKQKGIILKMPKVSDYIDCSQGKNQKDIIYIYHNDTNKINERIIETQKRILKTEI